MTTAVAPIDTGVLSRSLVIAYLSCRVGDELTDGGHMIVPSIGQVM
ncbi:MAG: hypothetical protein JSS38_08720 [Nitrospira sp.]|nr:hypothetical protein [Nitrospira sp.]